MKKAALLLIVFLGGVVVGTQIKSVKKRIISHFHVDSRIGVPVQDVHEEKPFVFLIMSYNNEDWVDRNLSSVFSQKYDNYRVLYLDDASKDRTSELVKKYANPKMSVIRNEKNIGSMANMYQGMQQIKEHEIVIVLDGDDWLPHDQVLNRLNHYYNNEQVWLTYGQHEEYPSKKKGFCTPISPNRVREDKFVTSHLRSFYAKLFHTLSKEDFMMEGEFVKTATDVVTMLPMMELAGDHAFFIPEILYIYNQDNVNADWRKSLSKQKLVEEYIRRLKPYAPLEVLCEKK
ncbi:MAG: hypothetical protein SP1CHLAM54_15490 [Chlamydiia bacterium]|nr:hypothetical protein [Chlamydiia bacterium]MCH9616439.1 hypothetical protein [Chlamydiia bacterium]MCH9629575.1 hypothetical protein [Chlamydiia bacterium]